VVAGRRGKAQEGEAEAGISMVAVLGSCCEPNYATSYVVRRVSCVVCRDKQ
jgi:hypothetical protein